MFVDTPPLMRFSRVLKRFLGRERSVKVIFKPLNEGGFAKVNRV